MLRGGLHPVAVLLVITAFLAPARVSAADETDRPWAQDVTAEDQERATALFQQGNGLLDEGLFAPALDIYQQALAHWSHPAIHYNTAVALINLERPVDAYGQLESALRYGAAALEKEVYEQARVYQKLLEGQLGRLSVECDLEGARVSLDGKQLLTCPGTRTQLLVSGEHQIVADKVGYLTRTARLLLGGGETKVVRIELMPLERATVTRRRWAAWKPWAVVGAGVALGLAGAGFEAKAEATFESYDNAIAVLCADRPCDELPEVVTDAYDRGRLQNRVGIGLLAAGSATIATGVVLLILNRPIEERIGYEDLSVAPSVGTDRVGVTAKVSF